MRLDLVCIETTWEEQSKAFLQELSSRGIPLCSYKTVERGELSAYLASKASVSDLIFCFAKKTDYQEISAHYADLIILWLPEDEALVWDLFSKERSFHFSFLPKENKEVLELELQKHYGNVAEKIFLFPRAHTVSFILKGMDLGSMKIGDLPFLAPLFGGVFGNIPHMLQKIFITCKKNLALAESCTGGYLAHAITTIPGSSQYFLGSLVTYCNEMKKNILHVREETLLSFGAVSRQVVEEMVDGVFSLTQTDVAIAVSGVAGPGGGTQKSPVGTVWFCISQKGVFKESFVLHLSGTRQEIITETSFRVLAFLYQKMALLSL